MTLLALMIFQVLEAWCFFGTLVQLTEFGLFEVEHIEVCSRVEIMYSSFCFQLQVVSLFSTTICDEENYRYHEYYFEII
jgi:hypothetical protein